MGLQRPERRHRRPRAERHRRLRAGHRRVRAGRHRRLRAGRRWRRPQPRRRWWPGPPPMTTRRRQPLLVPGAIGARAPSAFGAGAASRARPTTRVAIAPFFPFRGPVQAENHRGRGCDIGAEVEAGRVWEKGDMPSAFFFGCAGAAATEIPRRRRRRRRQGGRLRCWSRLAAAFATPPKKTSLGRSSRVITSITPPIDPLYAPPTKMITAPASSATTIGASTAHRNASGGSPAARSRSALADGG